MNKTEEKQSKKRLILILVIVLAGLIIIGSAGVIVWDVFFREPDVILTPDYAPQEEEENGETIPGDDDTKLEKPEGGGSVSMIWSKEVTIDLSDKQATLLFGNPGKSNVDVVVQLVIQDEIIIQSGKLVPDKQVKTLDLLPGTEKKLAPGGYNGKFVILYYDQENGEKAILNSDIPLTITVKE